MPIALIQRPCHRAQLVLTLQLCFCPSIERALYIQSSPYIYPHTSCCPALSRTQRHKIDIHTGSLPLIKSRYSYSKMIVEAHRMDLSTCFSKAIQGIRRVGGSLKALLCKRATSSPGHFSPEQFMSREFLSPIAVRVPGNSLTVRRDGLSHGLVAPRSLVELLLAPATSFSRQSPSHHP